MVSTSRSACSACSASAARSSSATGSAAGGGSAVGALVGAFVGAPTSAAESAIDRNSGKGSQLATGTPSRQPRGRVLVAALVASGATSPMHETSPDAFAYELP